MKLTVTTFANVSEQGGEFPTRENGVSKALAEVKEDVVHSKGVEK